MALLQVSELLLCRYTDYFLGVYIGIDGSISVVFARYIPAYHDLPSGKNRGKSIGRLASYTNTFPRTLPSGKLLHNYGKSPFCSWENPLFLWSFSIAM